jgi:hypothetical protein
MFQLFIVILVFSVVLFFYIHIYHNYKTSNDLEVYELEEVSKQRLEDVCNLKQPFMFNYSESLVQHTDLYKLDDHYQSFDINIRKNMTEDDLLENNDVEDEDPAPEETVPLPINEALALFKKDTASSYFTESNQDFLTESGIGKHIQSNDGYLRPPFVTNCIYDVMAGSKGASTPLRYEMNYRNYYLVTHGSAEILLIPPKYSKYLYPENDYESFEFKSPIHVWKVQGKYKADYNKTKHIKVVMNPGKVLYIPPYWWYSIRFNKRTSITSMKYRTVMNNVSMSPWFVMHFLQLYNVKRNTIENIKVIDSTSWNVQTNVPSTEEPSSQVSATSLPAPALPSILSTNNKAKHPTEQ